MLIWRSGLFEAMIDYVERELVFHFYRRFFVSGIDVEGVAIHFIKRTRSAPTSSAIRAAIALSCTSVT
jgi:hypothetical protein